MSIVMYLTHEETRQFYTGHEGEKEVNGKIDRMVKERIGASSGAIPIEESSFTIEES